MTRVFFAIAAAILVASAAFAVQNPLRDRLLGNERQQAPVGWYQRADTGEFFVFDRSGDIAYLRERDEQGAEIFVLYPNRAAGGGTAYVTDMGREVIRLTGLGGVTYFPPDAPDGVIADFASPSGALTPTPRSPQEVRERAEALVGDLTRQLDRAISVEYSPAPRIGLGVQYDALNLIGIAFDEARGDRRRYRGLNRVQVVTGPQIAAYVQGDALVVMIMPEAGHAGRPSSAFIAEALRLGEQPS